MENKYSIVVALPNIEDSEFELKINGEAHEFGTLFETENPEVEVEVIPEKYYNTWKENLRLEESSLGETIDITPSLEKLSYTVTIKGHNSPVIDVTYQHNDNEAEPVDGDIEIVEYPVFAGDNVIVTINKKDYEIKGIVFEDITENKVIDIATEELQPILHKLEIIVKDKESNKNIEDCIITVDGTEYTGVNFQQGTYSIKVEKAGYETSEGDIELVDDKSIIVLLQPNEYQITVTTDSNNTIKFNDEVSEDGKLTILGGRTLVIDVTREHMQPWHKEFEVIDNQDFNVVLEPKKVLLTINADKGKFSDNTNFHINENVYEEVSKSEKEVIYSVEENKEYHVVVEEAGFKTFETDIEIIDEDYTIELDWVKPTLSVIIVEGETIHPLILVDNKPLTNGTEIIVDYNSTHHIKVTADGYKTEEFDTVVTENVSQVVELKSETEGKAYFLGRVTDNTNSKFNISFLVNGRVYSPDTKIWFETGTKILVQVSKYNCQDIVENIVLDENVEKNYELNWKKYFVEILSVPSNAEITIKSSHESYEETRIEIVEGKFEGNFEVGTVLEVSVEAEGFKKENKTFVVNRELHETIVLEELVDSSENACFAKMTFEDMKRLLLYKDCYSYLQISCFLLSGLTEENVKKFYYYFGSYVTDRFDIYLWRFMKYYFGVKDGQMLAEPVDVAPNKPENVELETEFNNEGE